MRSVVRSRVAGAADDIDDRRNPRPFVLQALGWSNRDAVGFAMAVLASLAILVNVLWLQTGQHPAPMLKTGLLPMPPAKHATVGALPGPRAASPAAAGSAAAKPAPGKPEPAAAAPAVRTATEIVTDIQRELARRGFYDDAVDGRYGAKTEAAIRNFERAAGLKPSAAPDEALLRAIASSKAKAAKPAAGAPQTAAGAPSVAAPRAAPGLPQSLRPPAPIPAPAAPRHLTPPAPIPSASARPDAPAEASAPKRVVAVQRALADYGYGQIKPTGVIDAQTQAAIQKFERERKLPVTGQPSERVARELASITGRGLD